MRRLVSIMTVGVGLLVTAESAALEFGTPGTSHPYRSPQHFALELRGGPYRPNIDDEPGLKGTPFKDSFGTKDRLYLGLEFDWQAFRIPYVGTIGPGVSVGRVSMSENARTVYTKKASGDEYGLTIYPMSLSAVLRVDSFWRGAGIPLIPYAKAGGAVGLWQATSADETARAQDGARGKGATLGVLGAVGVALPLNALDPSAARSLDTTTGVNTTSIYFEYDVWRLNGFGSNKVLYVGSNTWVTGLSFEF
jgi:hypothetical protein